MRKLKFCFRQSKSQLLKNWIWLFLLNALISCNSKTEILTSKQSTEVKDSVQQMIHLVSKDISHDGPIAWLRYFETEPNFFMASTDILFLRITTQPYYLLKIFL